MATVAPAFTTSVSKESEPASVAAVPGDSVDPDARRREATCPLPERRALGPIASIVPVTVPVASCSNPALSSLSKAPGRTTTEPGLVTRMGAAPEERVSSPVTSRIP